MVAGFFGGLLGFLLIMGTVGYLVLRPPAADTSQPVSQAQLVELSPIKEALTAITPELSTKSMGSGAMPVDEPYVVLWSYDPNYAATLFSNETLPPGQMVIRDVGTSDNGPLTRDTLARQKYVVVAYIFDSGDEEIYTSNNVRRQAVNVYVYDVASHQVTASTYKPSFPSQLEWGTKLLRVGWPDVCAMLETPTGTPASLYVDYRSVC
ncbi:MAG: hypothetical protein FWG16_08785 [Micrococcales bacterium]|nr:hypothetical protein [Micrococcales bacterium]